jgi:hypothetical protein
MFYACRTSAEDWEDAAGMELTGGGGRKTGRASGGDEAKSLPGNDSRLEVHEKSARLYELRELRRKNAVFSDRAALAENAGGRLRN